MKRGSDDGAWRWRVLLSFYEIGGVGICMLWVVARSIGGWVVQAAGRRFGSQRRALTGALLVERANETVNRQAKKLRMK